jgi:intracellular septation protein
MNSKLSSFFEYAPIIIFFLCYKFFGMMNATYALLGTTIISSIIMFYYMRKISYMQIVTLVLVVVMGVLTIYSGDSRFIKMKPTIINILFFLVLSGGLLFDKGLMQYVLGQKFDMSHDNWKILSKRWCLFFLICAILNEIIWRNFSEDVWINFKVFGLMIITVLFVFTQMRFLTKFAVIKSIDDSSK